MTKSEAVNFFGKQINIARALNRSKNTVCGWDEKLPSHIQYELQVRTNGALKVDPDLHQEALTGKS